MPARSIILQALGVIHRSVEHLGQCNHHCLLEAQAKDVALDPVGREAMSVKPGGRSSVEQAGEAPNIAVEPQRLDLLVTE